MPEEVVRGAMLIRVNSLSRLVVVLQRKSSELMLLMLGDTLRSAFAFSRRSFASSRRESRPSFLSVARSLRVEICRLCVVPLALEISSLRPSLSQLSYIAGAITGHPDIKVITRMYVPLSHFADRKSVV